MIILRNGELALLEFFDKEKKKSDKWLESVFGEDPSLRKYLRPRTGRNATQVRPENENAAAEGGAPVPVDDDAAASTSASVASTSASAASNSAPIAGTSAPSASTSVPAASSSAPVASTFAPAADSGQ